MATVDEDPMAEINESLRIMGEADLRWALLVRKIAKLHPVPQAPKENARKQPESPNATARGCDRS
jgi:hypothetical protein